MDYGKVQLILVATSTGHVIYERFYDRLSEQEKAEVRTSIAEVSEGSAASVGDYSEHASRYRDSAVAFRKEGEICYFAVGSGEFDELQLAEVLGALSTALKEILRKAPSEAQLFDNYARLCLIVDELIFEGIVNKTEPEQIQGGIMMKVE